MSGGFFRGTSADQDTRFSNKQAKLMKSQKFAPELEHLVDMTKVKIDVVKPWIATRVTEFLGFEDEVLINFIYGLLDAKEVNGKEVQISLTGFMEKNTGKFMRELWTLLLSAQKNATGVPQQFLDAKEEETRKKKAEADQIAGEIQKRKDMEAKEFEQEKLRKMDGGAGIPKVTNAVVEPNSKTTRRRASSAEPEDEKERDERNGLRGQKRVSKSPHSAGGSPSSPRGTPSRKISKSRSNSRSYSDERSRSRSESKSPQPRGRSTSSERAYRSTRRRSITPRRRRSPPGSLSPPRRKSSNYMRRSRSRSYRRSVSPVRRRFRSPLRRRSPSPVRRRSPSPVRRRSPSPVRRRFRSPVRRRSPSPVSPSPVRRRSPSPTRRRSPSPTRLRSPYPVRRRSPSPVRRRHRRSPSPPRRGSPPLMRRRSPIAGRRRSPIPSRRRSPSPYGWNSPSPSWRRSPSPVRRKFPEDRRRSPLRSPRERADDLVEKREGPDSVAGRPPSSMRSPQRDAKDRSNSRKRAPSWSPSPEKSPILSESPPGTKKMIDSEDRIPYKSPVRQTRGHMAQDDSRGPPQRPKEHKSLHESQETSGRKEGTNYSREDRDLKPKSSQKRSMPSSILGKEKDFHKEDSSPERSAGHQTTESRSNIMDLRKRNQETKSEKISGRMVHPEVTDKQKSPTTNKHSTLAEMPPVSDFGERNKADEKNRSHSNNTKDSGRHDKSDTVLNNQSGSFDSGSEDSDKDRVVAKEKRKHKRSDRHEKDSDGDNSSDSQIEDRKEAKRRKKEEKRVRKEEKRRRHEEKRRRRREERRAEKLKARSKDSLTPPSDIEKNKEDNYASDGEHVARMKSGSSDAEEAESEQKKLEIELRKKALESLRAKKGISH